MVSTTPISVNRTELPATKGSTMVHRRLWNIDHAPCFTGVTLTEIGMSSKGTILEQVVHTLWSLSCSGLPRGFSELNPTSHWTPVLAPTYFFPPWSYYLLTLHQSLAQNLSAPPLRSEWCSFGPLQKSCQLNHCLNVWTEVVSNTVFVLWQDATHNNGQKSWDTSAFLGRFPIHTGPTPSLTPHTILDACIQNFFPVSTLYRVGGGRTARKFWKECTVLRGNWEMTEKYE